MTKELDFTRAIDRVPTALGEAGFRGDVEADTALLAAMATDNSIYRIRPDLIVAPQDADDVVTFMAVMEQPMFTQIPITPRGGGTGTNGQSLNRGVILDMRRHMHRLLEVNVEEGWADVEPGMVLDDLNARLEPHGLFFAPETSTSTRCTIGGMVSTDASGKGSRIYGKTSDNIVGIEIARGRGLVASDITLPDWARPMISAAEQAARGGRAAFVANTPRLSRRFTGYDLERACPPEGGFEWWRLFPGSEGTLGPITRVRVRLRSLPQEKRLLVAAFDTFRDSLSAASPLLEDDPIAIEVMDEGVQALARDVGLLSRLPEVIRPDSGTSVAYAFIEFSGVDAAQLDARVAMCQARLHDLLGFRAAYVTDDLDEIRALWAVRSAGVGLLGKVKGRARPVAFVEDCVVPPESLPRFLDKFLEILSRHKLNFGIYGHVDVGCLHIRPAIDIDTDEGRDTLVRVSDEIFQLVCAFGGIFWGEHGKGVRGAYLERWIGPEAYRALRQIKIAFDPDGRFNPGKLVSGDGPVSGIDSIPFRPFNTDRGDPLENAFRCNGNAHCLSFVGAIPMCPSFKATGDLRHSPKGRADALRTWREDKKLGKQEISEIDLLGVLDTCLGCKACTSSCPVQVDIPWMRAAFYADYYKRNQRPFADRMTLALERKSPSLVRAVPVVRPVWPIARAVAEGLMRLTDLPVRLARSLPPEARISCVELSSRTLPENAVLIWQDWFSALFDEAAQRDVFRGLCVLGYRPFFVEMLPSGKAAADLGDWSAFREMASRLKSALDVGAAHGVPMIGFDPAFVMTLRQDYAKSGWRLPTVHLPQEFLLREMSRGAKWPMAEQGARPVTLLSHCTEITAMPQSGMAWRQVFSALGIETETPATGCCGMAGVFGHKIRHQVMSRRLFKMSWEKPISEAHGDLAASGFSCRCQGRRFSGRNLRHPLGVIADRLGTD